METELTSLMPHLSIISLRLVDYSRFVDLEELIVFQQSEIPPDHAPPHWTREEFEDYLNRGEIIKGIFDCNKLFAFYIVHIRSSELHISEVGVHPDYRGRGFGRSIIQLLEKKYKKNGLKKCSLTVDPFNQRAIHLYLRCGYKITAYKKAYYGDSHPNTDRFWMENIFDSCEKFEEKSLKIRVDNPSSFELAFQNSFVGVELLCSLDQNNKHNFIVLRK